MTPRQMHEEMSKVIHRLVDPRLKHYQDDFNLLDLRYLEHAWHPDARMLWVVRESGTHLIPLGVHPKLAEEGMSILAMGDSQGAPKEAYLLTSQGVASLTMIQARGELSRMNWSLDTSGRIHNMSTPIADIADIIQTRVGNKLYADVKIYMFKPTEELSMGELVALRIFSERAAISKAGTLFLETRSVRLGASDLDTLLDAKREAWLSKVAAPGYKAAAARQDLAQQSLEL